MVPPNATTCVLAMNDELHVRVTITDLPRDIKIRIGALVDGPHRTCVPAWHCNRIPSIRGRIACANILENLLERVASLRENDSGARRGGRSQNFVGKECILQNIHLFCRWHRLEYNSGAPVASHRAIIRRWIEEVGGLPQHPLSCADWKNFLLLQLELERHDLPFSCQKLDQPLDERAARNHINREFPLAN